MRPLGHRSETPRFTNNRLAFLMVVPLAWAVLLWFHPGGERDSVYASLRDEVTTWQVVHVGTLIFIGLMGIALYLLMREVPGRAATVSRLAIGPFVLFYGAWEAVIGLGTGALAQHANDAPPSERPAVADAIQALQDNVIIGDPGVVGVVGALAWITAVIAAVVAYRGLGAPAAVLVLLGLSAVVVSHPPPIGPIGLVCFAAAVGLLAVRERRAPAAAARARPPAATTALTACDEFVNPRGSMKRDHRQAPGPAEELRG